MDNCIFNLRIWYVHFQIADNFNIRPIFAWFDMWIGLFINQNKNIWYIFPVPMLGLKIQGIRIGWNKSYEFRKYPFVWLFQFGKWYNPYTRKDVGL